MASDNSDSGSPSPSASSYRPFWIGLGAVLLAAAVIALSVGLAVGFGGSDCPSKPDRNASANCR